MNAKRQPWFETAALRRLAVEAEADPRTVRRVIQGKRARGMVDGRIRRVLARRGLPTARKS